MEIGGEIIIHAVNRFDKQYEIRRVLNELHSDVYIGDQLSPVISIRETALQKPLYFGQKTFPIPA
jgi:hypothetical protein